jgi:hypothetical protein
MSVTWFRAGPYFPLVDQLFGALLQFGNWSLAGIDVPLAYGYEGYL